MEKLKIAVIGCGSIARKHIKAIAENKDKLELTALCDIDPQKTEQLAAGYQQLTGKEPGKIKKHTDYEKILKDQEIDIVAITTSSGIRPKIAIGALDEGKHLILEKPMALSTKDADHITKKAEQKGLKVTVCHQLRFLPHIQKLKEIVNSGTMGKIVHAAAAMRWNRSNEYYSSSPWRGTWKHDGGAFMNQAIHLIDLLLWIMGPVQTVYAETGTFIKKIEAEDAGAALLRFKNDALGVIEASVCVYPENLEETLGVFGEKGTVVIGGKTLDIVKTWNIKDQKPYETEKEQKDLHVLLYEDMINAVKENREPLINAKEGQKAVELVLSIYKSSLTKKPVKLPPGDFSTEHMIGG
ncbi:Gfo/Idh/MocA family protein [Thermosediminibacter oceani]|uniref:Oxidoreductase domain protein n=1 Tax=Thermosediminibacter oceani (strain ATCC BAA-1034 / DSM 16646 / JW/IW-1228P) TaxID=555079 RepID=D9RYA6_THEOJ|nr:Gfo/Idh/MocA family oxidoreductase [Thermosediminibacter oceani]ADL08330.1 oxidoreductase domain protein [Thermosediminibacter oceani DSM 16646]